MKSRVSRYKPWKLNGWNQRVEILRPVNVYRHKAIRRYLNSWKSCMVHTSLIYGIPRKFMVCWFNIPLRGGRREELFMMYRCAPLINCLKSLTVRVDLQCKFHLWHVIYNATPVYKLAFRRTLGGLRPSIMYGFRVCPVTRHFEFAPCVRRKRCNSSSFFVQE